MAATDARYFHRYCPATYRFAPLMMNAEQRAAIGITDSLVRISAGIEAADDLIADIDQALR